MAHQTNPGLARRDPGDSAATVLDRRQALVLVAALATVAVALDLAPGSTLAVLCVAGLTLCACASTHRVALCLIGLHAPSPGPSSAPLDLAECDLPTYTILLPLYDEAPVVAGLVDAITRLDYPPDRLDVKILLEREDQATRAALPARTAQAPFEVLTVPLERRTKPKSCNHGLAHATGEYLVVFDAEDRPEPDQLRRAVAAFHGAPAEVACLQARLRFGNRTQRLLTRLMAMEFAQKFELLLPGLERVGAPIPLGGSSNHFHTRVLRELGGWDAFNVTEDLELGHRLAGAGYRVHVLDSVTWGEAPARLGPWVGQRARWLKGHLQTWLVLTRHPVRNWRRLGTAGWLHAQLLTAGAVLLLLFNGTFSVLATVWALGELGLCHPPLLPSSLYLGAALQVTLGNAAFAGVNILGLVRSRQPGLGRAIVLLPAYWLLIGAAAWRALLELIVRPTHWEKTPHGLTPPELAEAGAGSV